MTTKPFDPDKALSASDLSIEEWEREELIKLVPVLETQVRHIITPRETPATDNSRLGFNMAYSGGTWECGTVACIGGWIRLNHTGYDYTQPLTVDQECDVTDYVADADALRDLFYPPDHMAFSYITPLKAREAVINFLYTGDPKWEEI